ncbi:MAG: hypothetical protein QGG36_04385, partial [Pirellulaceae bacterium]|nr:hypothetical protein [Pirellulaceae bacterium]
TLQAVLDRAPQLQRLHIDHPPNGVPASIRLITQFPRLEELKITGDANLDDSAFASIGRLKRLKTLNMSLP